MWGDSRLAKHVTHPIGKHLNYWITSENVNGIYFSMVYMVNLATFSCERRGAPTATRPVGDPVLRRGHAPAERQLAGGHQGQPLAPHAQGKYLREAATLFNVPAKRTRIQISGGIKKHFNLNFKLLFLKAPSADDTHAYINVYYVSIDKNDHAFLTQEKSTRVSGINIKQGWGRYF